MKTLELKLQKRTEVGEAATRTLRKEQMVPCEIYNSKENIHCYGRMLDFEKGIVTPHVYLFDLDIDGEKRKAIIQEIQYHPVTDRIIHVDFIAVDDVKAIKISLPVELVGISVGVAKGGKLRLVKRKLKINGLLKNIPEVITIDISTLDVGQNIKIGQIEIPGVEFTEPKQTVVVNVGASRTTAKAE